MVRKKYTESTRWNEWRALIDRSTCHICRNMHGKILSIYDVWSYEPPVHKMCRCTIIRLKAIMAGTATDLGAYGADWYLKYIKRLPPYYISKLTAKNLGWKPGLRNLDNVAPDKMIGGDVYYNFDGKLPEAPFRKWYEADINYTRGKRNDERILYSSDGLIFATYNHYETFIEVK